jgi:predicted sulfurtransferase
VLDCRNDFESEVGRFTTAEPLNTSFFRDSWDVLKGECVASSCCRWVGAG